MGKQLKIGDRCDRTKYLGAGMDLKIIKGETLRGGDEAQLALEFALFSTFDQIFVP